MATAQERESALRPVRDRAQQAVAGLEAEIRGYEAEAHDSYGRGDAAAGDASQAKAAALKPGLAAACGRLRTLEEAIGVLAGERHREHLEGQLAAVNQAIAETAATAQREAADVHPALAAAKLALRRAQQAEDLARQLEAERYELEIHLGMRERGRSCPVTSTVQAMLERSRYLADLLADPEL